MRRPLQGLGCVGLWLWAALALVGPAVGLGAEPAEKGDAEKGAGEPVGVRHVVIIQDRVPLQFGDSQIGELCEGLRGEIREVRDDWCRVRVNFGQNWFEGWVRQAVTAPDSLLELPLKVAPTRPLDVYRDPVENRRDYILPGMQFLEVRVKFDPTEKSPRRVYFSWTDEGSADVYVRYSRESKALPYGFIRRVQGMTRAAFDRDEKRQTLILAPGESVIETYVFAVPVRAREFDLVLKDITTRIPVKR